MTTAIARPLAAFLLVAGTLAALLLGAGPAAAHATLTGSTPADGEVVAMAPTEVGLTFSEQVSLSDDDGIRVLDPEGERVDTGGLLRRDGAGAYAVALKAELADGTYTVAWQAVSNDSHPIAGAFTFSVGAPSETSVALPQGNPGEGLVGLLYDIFRYAAYTGFLLLVGPGAFALLCWPGAAGSRAVQRITLTGWLTLGVATAVLLLLRIPYTTTGELADVFDLDGLAEVVDSRAGTALLTRLVLISAAALFVALLHGRFARAHADGDVTTARDLRFGLGVGGGALAVGLAATWAMAEHAATGRQTELAIPADIVHLLAVGCWLGGLVTLLVLLRGDVPPPARAVRRFSALALGSVTALAVTGLYQSWRQVGTASALFGTDYGRLLIAKVALVAVLLAVAWTSRRWTALTGSSAGETAAPDGELANRSADGPVANGSAAEGEPDGPAADAETGTHQAAGEGTLKGRPASRATADGELTEGPAVRPASHGQLPNGAEAGDGEPGGPSAAGPTMGTTDQLSAGTPLEPADEPDGGGSDESAGRPPKTPDQLAAETPLEPADNPTDEPADKPGGGGSDESAGRPPKTPNRLAAETPTEPTDEPANGPSDEPVDNPTDEPTDNPADEPGDGGSDQSAGRPPKTPDQLAAETPTEPADEPANGPSDEPVDNPTDEPVGQAGGGVSGGAAGRPAGAADGGATAVSVTRARQLARQRAAVDRAASARRRDADPARAGLRRSVLLEAGIAAVLLAVTTALTATTPARTEAATPAGEEAVEPAPVPVPYDTGGPAGSGTATLELTPSAVGDNVLHILLADPEGRAAEAAEVRVSLTLPSEGLGPLRHEPAQVTVGHWTATDVSLPRPGEWELALTIRTSEIDQTTETTTVTIP
ncbi:copper resistance protein CopC [Streptomyces profundus]|uniref:copper resistance protein CopC n=1 Tax=Streptomyces profundus TaxID=2867410 RepID=UPI003CC871B6